MSSATFPYSHASGLAGSILSAPARAQDFAITRQRSKLWELSGSVHCSIIGTCLTTAELRRVMGKVVATDITQASDHDLHGQAVGLCSQHNACSKLLQKGLDQRHQTAIRQFARLHGEAAVMEAWRAALRAGDIPGAYWATLTHPDVGYAGLRQAFGDVHMLSHLVGAANRADIRRLAELEEQNAGLRQKVERQQARLQEAITARDATIRGLSDLAAQQVRDAAQADAGDMLATLKHLVADLQDQLAAQIGRRERLEQRVAEADRKHQGLERRARQAELERDALRQELAVTETRLQSSTEPGFVPGLPAQRILYVGGRPGCVDQMRGLLEGAGGELLCHDGGRHDHPSLLPGLIGRADRVVFPVDCVSHDAALTVKRLCRQNGKAWLPLRTSGVASFVAALAAS